MHPVKAIKPTCSRTVHVPEANAFPCLTDRLLGQIGGRAGMAAMVASLIGDLDFMAGLLECLQSRHHVRLVRGDRGSGGP
jgi:hypothetical protein